MDNVIGLDHCLAAQNDFDILVVLELDNVEALGRVGDPLAAPLHQEDEDRILRLPYLVDQLLCVDFGALLEDEDEDLLPLQVFRPVDDLVQIGDERREDGLVPCLDGGQQLLPQHVLAGALLNQVAHHLELQAELVDADPVLPFDVPVKNGLSGLPGLAFPPGELPQGQAGVAHVADKNKLPSLQLRLRHKVGENGLDFLR